MIKYDNIARVRREVENILLLVDELDKRGIPKALIIETITNEPKGDIEKDGHTNKNE